MQYVVKHMIRTISALNAPNTLNIYYIKKSFPKIKRFYNVAD